MIRKICCLVGGVLGLIVVSILVIAYYLHFGYILPGKAQVGHLIVTLSDTEGRPITDATVFVKTLNRVGIMSGKYERDYNQFSARTDSNGVADVSFQFLASHFDRRLETPSHHSKAVRFQSDYFSRASNVVYRTMSFFPKRNPRPMFAYGNMDYLRLPTNRTEYVSNGVKVVRCPTVAVDLEKCELLPPFNNRTPAGVHADFQFERYYVETNGVGNYYGRIVFPPGCGAYKGIKTRNVSFPSTYEADTNAVFLSEISFSSVRDLATGRGLFVRHLLETNEYMVLRTRLSVSDNGVTNGWHYSKILGPIYVSGAWSFEELVFNPRLNDPNLEFDHNSNLARSRGGQLFP